MTEIAAHLARLLLFLQLIINSHSCYSNYFTIAFIIIVVVVVVVIAAIVVAVMVVAAAAAIIAINL